jgi:hypothetical protein
MLAASKYVSGMQLGGEAAKSCVRNHVCTLIPETSFETLRSEDSLAKHVDAFGAE